MLFVVLCPGTPKAQPAVVLVLKRLRRRDNSLKSHPTDWNVHISFLIASNGSPIKNLVQTNS